MSQICRVCLNYEENNMINLGIDQKEVKEIWEVLNIVQPCEVSRFFILFTFLLSFLLYFFL